MAIETIGQAHSLDWRLTARCDWGPRDGMKRRRECVYSADLDLATLVWTRGPSFPLSLLASRLKCPACGSRRVTIIFRTPSIGKANRIAAE
jgi:hypothetical protein